MNVLSLTCAELVSEIKRRFGKGLFHGAALYREIFKRGASTAFVEAPEFLASPALAEKLAADVRLPACRIAARREDGGVVKCGVELTDGRIVEFVVIPAKGRTTVCVSSQVGCRMGCAFCATAGMGFTRNLAADEIVWQVWAARFQLGFKVNNVVFMGMGEPLDNFDDVVQAVRVMNDQRGLDIPLRRITISTAGDVDGVHRLAALGMRNLCLAISLHATDDALRSALMPINRRCSLASLKQELLAFPLPKNGVVFIEYLLLAGVNDSRPMARDLARYLDGLPARVNVIAYNEARPGGRFAPPSPEHARRFCGWLAEEGLFVRLRESRGRGAMAACGQLGAELATR